MEVTYEVEKNTDDKTDDAIIEKVLELSNEEFFALRGLLEGNGNPNIKQFGKWMQWKRRD